MRKDPAPAKARARAKTHRETGEAHPTRRRAAARSGQRPDDGRSAIERMQELSRSSQIEARLSACKLAVTSYDEAPEDTMAALFDLAADGDRAVTSAAVSASARIAVPHFGRIEEILCRWRDGSSSGARRAVAAAAARAADPRKLERAPRLVRLVEPLLADPDPAVRRQLAPSALGALLGAYPDATFEALIGWSTSSDPHVLRNVAMAFASASAAPLAKRALIVLRKLALDERHIVWRAAAAAMWQLGRRRPDVVRPELERWLSDETREKVARQALKYL